jgi:hypothetical protein
VVIQKKYEKNQKQITTVFGVYSVDSLCSRVGHEREAANFVRNALGFQVFFRLADPGDFGVRVDHRRNAVVIDVHIFKL